MFDRQQVLRWIERQGFQAPAKATLYRWIAEGYFPRPVRLGRQARWSEKSLKSWAKRELA